MANKVGRPRKYKCVEEVQRIIDKYFEETDEQEWTVTGLAYALDLDRNQLINYSKDEEYYYTIKRAKDKVQISYEKSLRKNGRSGDIFALKNFGWRDTQDINANVDASVDINITNNEI